MPARSPDFGKTWGNQNCYAYAISNDGSNTGTVDVESGRNPSNITPGQFSGDYDLDVNDAQEMDRAIVRDKAIRACPQNAPALPAVGSKPGYYLIACKCGGGNYHFVRRDENDGSWWQKMPMTGPGSAAIVDGFTPHFTRGIHRPWMQPCRRIWDGGLATTGCLRRDCPFALS